MTSGESTGNKTRIVVLSGPSGSGKTTIVRRLIEHCTLPIVKCISATTRPKRRGELDGEHYYFLSIEEFQRRRDHGEFLEWAEVHGGGFYGTLKSEVGRARDAGAWALLEIDVQGALKVMQEHPDAVTVFLKTPSVEEYERRLRARGTEAEAVIQRRLQTAREELGHVHRYRHQVINEDLDRAVTEICEILTHEHEGRD
ncbi:MAG: guanylate kinase [Planctomycetaceae bacterium]